MYIISMKTKLEVGKVYTVAGRGEVLLVEITKPKGILRVASHGTTTPGYWVDPKDVVREATRADLDAREAQARPRGVGCNDKECWCRFVQ
jgi:hypothetical protein